MGSRTEKTWKEKHTTGMQKTCVVDLNDVTFIDKGGEKLLRAISKTGADLISNGMYTKHLLEQLKTRERSSQGCCCACVWG